MFVKCGRRTTIDPPRIYGTVTEEIAPRSMMPLGILPPEEVVRGGCLIPHDRLNVGEGRKSRLCFSEVKTSEEPAHTRAKH